MTSQVSSNLVIPGLLLPLILINQAIILDLSALYLYFESGFKITLEFNNRIVIIEVTTIEPNGRLLHNLAGLINPNTFWYLCP
jgi:hypothetical protein